jgi:DNA-binding transcriptional LysR family regulator
MRFDILTLKFFAAIVEEQSIAKAAEREHIAASAVSKRISDLEETLGIALLNRLHKGIEPTAAGYALLHHARAVLRNLAELETEFVGYSEGTRGLIRIFANVTAIFQYLPEDLSAFLAAHPLVQIELEEQISSASIRAVAENLADIGIFAGTLHTGALQVFPYHEDRLVVVAAHDHPLARLEKVRFADMARHDLVGLQKGSSIDSLLARGAAAIGAALRIRIRVSGFDAVCRMSEARLGVGLVPQRFIDLAGSMNVVVRPLDEEWALRPLSLCVRSLDSLPLAARLLVQHLRAG